MRAVLAAFQFLTRLPLGFVRLQAKDLTAAAYFYGFVGLAIGGILAVVNRGLNRFVPLDARLVLVLVVNVLLTGGLHLDGLADTVDGVMGGATPEQALSIMRDSRIGTFGVLALISVLALQFVAMRGLTPRALTQALILAPAWGRTSLVLAGAISRPARNEGLGASFVAGVRARHVLASALTVIIAAVLLSRTLALWSALVAAASTLVVITYLVSRVGGMSGDTLGTVNETTETAILWLYLLAA